MPWYIAGNIFSVRAHAVNKLSTKTIFAKTTSPLRTIPNSNISRQIPFSFLCLSSKIIILWFCLNSRWIGCLILVSQSWEHPPAVLYTQIVRTNPISAKIHKSEAVYFLISNDVSGICSRYITLVWTHSKFTFAHMCKRTHVQVCTHKQIFAVWMGLKNKGILYKLWKFFFEDAGMVRLYEEQATLDFHKDCVRLK